MRMYQCLCKSQSPALSCQAQRSDRGDKTLVAGDTQCTVRDGQRSQLSGDCEGGGGGGGEGCARATQKVER